ncbi:MAG: integrase/recombinase XerD [Actinomycetota bacterium]|nr:integrase/recombinase XerD [Actinomycetota bacterium]
MTRPVSGLAAHIDSLLDIKHAIGLPYRTSERHLRAFEAMCAEQCPGQATVNRQMAMRWAASRPGEHVNAQMRRITPVRQLAKHIAGLGIDAFVIPPGIPGRQIRYRPHLYSHAQLRAIFQAADRIVPSGYGGARHVIIPVIFRVIYCLGLRPGEARRLHRTDVDLTRGTIHIRESKGHKNRLVFLSADLHDYCRRYDAEISTHHRQRVAFFPKKDANFYSASTLDHWFGQLLDTAEPKIEATPGSPPRVYDLRHAHVVEVINTWARAGRDPEALVMYLSLHLGHANPEDTWYYFHLAADFHPDLRRLANTSIESVLTEPAHVI